MLRQKLLYPSTAEIKTWVLMNSHCRTSAKKVLELETSRRSRFATYRGICQVTQTSQYTRLLLDV